MLDLSRLNRVQLSARPWFQKLVGYAWLMPNYHLPPRVKVRFEHSERVPDEPVIYAMNHTDRYNYWPFQLKHWRSMGRFTATWVKGKYYENKLMGLFMELANNIPTVSRGYLITRDFLAAVGRRPETAEYKALRALVSAFSEDPSVEFTEPEGIPTAIFTTPRDMLGRRFDPDRESYASCVNALFGEMTRRFVALNEEAFDKGLDLLVFPQGTRSIRLSRGHIGLAQIALRYKRTIVPVGCNGSDFVYTGGSPIAKSGEIVYRFGEPIRYEELSEFHIDEPFQPLTAAAEQAYGQKFQGLVDVVMNRINELLDERYQYSPDGESEGVAGSSRFV